MKPSEMMICPKALTKRCEHPLRNHKHCNNHERSADCAGWFGDCPVCVPVPDQSAESQSATRQKLEELLDRIPCFHYPKSCPSDYLFPEPTETADLSEEQIEGIAAKLAELKASALKAYTSQELIEELKRRENVAEDTVPPLPCPKPAKLEEWRGG